MDYGAILINQATENKIYDIFRHHSKDATTVRMQQYEGYGKPKDYEPMFNYISGAISE